MRRTNERRRRYRIIIEPLEARELLSASSSSIPMMGRDATPSAPPPITARLAPKSDPDGNGVVLRSTVTIVGQTAPGARVRLEQAVESRHLRSTRANALGEYHFTIRLPVGRTACRVECIDTARQMATTGLT